MSEFAEAIEKLRDCERRMIAAETHATLGCGHHVSNLDRTVESGTALCRLCDLESRCRDAEKQERELAAENARLREWVATLRAVTKDALDTGKRDMQHILDNGRLRDRLIAVLAVTAPKETPCTT